MTTMATVHAHPAVQGLSHEPIPTSPTLTNPDMILPEHDSSPRSFRQSPPYMSLEIPSSTANGSSHGRPGVKPTMSSMSNPSYFHGAPLSDIGEEESTTMSRRDSDSGSATPIDDRSMASGQPWRLESQDTDDGETCSTVSGISDIGQWKDFDTDVPGGEKAGEDLTPTGKENAMDRPRSRDTKEGFSAVDGDEAESNALSERAERILANAKKRLTALEGNLNKARSSMALTPTRGLTGIGEHREVGGLYRSISQTGGARKTGGYRPLAQGSPGHNRVFSETSIPSKIPIAKPGEMRSVSAMEHNYNRSIDNVLGGTPSQPAASQKSPLSSGSPYSAYQSPLNVLQEDDAETIPLPQSPHGLGIVTSTSLGDLKKRQSMLDSPDGLQRSTSAASAKDLHDQVQGLKSKIANLRVQAKVDSLRRRSLQNLRDPSPFTAANGWEEGENGERSTPSPQSQKLRHKSGSLRLKSLSPTNGSSPLASDGVETPLTARHTPQKPQPEQDYFRTPNNMYEDGNLRTPVRRESNAEQSTYEDATEDMLDEHGNPIAASEEEQVYLNEALEESLHEGELMDDSARDEVSPEPERHEDRADAFDYEHFILHSALGSYSRVNDTPTSSKRSSALSSASVETTRPAEYGNHEKSSPPRMMASPGRPVFAGHHRTGSIDSISTVATFETATEGNASDEDDDDKMPQDILNWSGNQIAIRPRTAQPFPLAVQGGRNGALPTPPATSPRENPSRTEKHHLGSVAETLMSYADPSGLSRPKGSLPGNLESVDQELLEGLFQSIGVFCSDLAKKTHSSQGPTKYDRKMWRRRLDAARMVLDGECDIDPV